MGQGPSSIDYNYIYNEKNKLNNKQNKNQKQNNQVNNSEIDSFNNSFNELLNMLKYHTNMLTIDKNFVLKNKVINDELNDKIKHLKIQIKKNNEYYLTNKEYIQNYNLYNVSYSRYKVGLKYINMFMFFVIVILVAIRFLKVRSNILNI